MGWARKSKRRWPAGPQNPTAKTTNMDTTTANIDTASEPDTIRQVVFEKMRLPSGDRIALLRITGRVSQCIKSHRELHLLLNGVTTVIPKPAGSVIVVHGGERIYRNGKLYNDEKNISTPS